VKQILTIELPIHSCYITLHVTQTYQSFHSNPKDVKGCFFIIWSYRIMQKEHYF